MKKIEDSVKYVGGRSRELRALQGEEEVGNDGEKS